MQMTSQKCQKAWMPEPLSLPCTARKEHWPLQGPRSSGCPGQTTFAPAMLRCSLSCADPVRRSGELQCKIDRVTCSEVTTIYYVILSTFIFSLKAFCCCSAFCCSCKRRHGARSDMGLWLCVQTETRFEQYIYRFFSKPSADLLYLSKNIFVFIDSLTECPTTTGCHIVSATICSKKLHAE